MVEEAVDLEEELRGLYAGVPDAFVAARNALVKRLKAEKRAGEAATIGKLRRPSRVAWALNAAVAGDPGLGERVREAVDGLDGADDVRTANAALREASDALVSAARDAAREGGHALERGDLMPAALAVVGDPEALDDLLAVRLEDVPSGGGFGAFGFGVADAAPSRRDRPAAAATRPKAKGKATTKPKAGKGGTTQDDAAALAEAQAEAEREAARADARRALEEAEAEAEEAEAALAGAERALVSATADAEEAAERLREAQRAAEEADARRADSERAVGEAQRRYQDSERAVRTSRKALDDLR
ncbi:MAG TPA: hypothetical protein VKA65_01630 [Acidimicrobiales bacterium]|nr:hypothetical protein [Acidimicrobiales bacterium]